MIIPSVYNRSFRLVSDCHEKVADVGSRLTEATFKTLQTNHRFSFPKGHGAIATSWSHPETEYALHKRFGACRGPVRFQLDLEEAGETVSQRRRSK
jgi:hypothetical protein